MLFQIRAFGAEGMIEEMLRYLNVAEKVLWSMDPDQKSDLYGIVLHALVEAKEVRVYCLLPFVLQYEMKFIFLARLFCMLCVFSVELGEFDIPLSGLQTQKAIRTFKNMISCGLPTNFAIYNVMIECCKLLPCLKSACALWSLMLRDGYCPTVLSFTSLLKVRLVNCRAVTTHCIMYC